MAGPFVVESGVPGTQVWGVDFAGNTTQSGTVTAAVLAIGTQGASSMSGIQTYLAASGDNTSAEALANVITPTFGVSAASGTQLSDVTRDYMVYLTTTAGGANNTLTIGNNSTATTATITAAATIGTGTPISFRLPAGWFVRYQGAVAIGVQTAIAC